MRLILLLLVALCGLSSVAEAQIIAVSLKTEKQEKKFSKFLVDWKGQKVIVGEIKSGFKYDPQKGVLSHQPQAPNEIFVVNPDNPAEVPYTIVNGEKEPKSRRNRLTIQGPQIKRVSMLMPNQSLGGLTREYRIRRAQVDEFREERDQQEKGSTAWSAQHQRLIRSLERLRGWLEKTAFPGAVRKVDSELKKERRSVVEDAYKARADKAMNSVTELEVPERLKAIAKEVYGGSLTFSGMESQHIRVWYCQEITHEQVRLALLLGEEVIEGWRTEFVDPYISEAYADFIPDGQFQEFFFVPEDLATFQSSVSKFYGVKFREDWDPSLGGGATISAGKFTSYWRIRGVDLQGIFCHQLGHSLSTLHYGSGSRGIDQDWLTEGAAYYISFEHLGRNNVTCKAFHGEEEYVKRANERMQGEKTVGLGRRDLYNEVALQEGRPITQLALRELFEMDDADLAKSWSFYDYICRKEGKQGQEWLRAAAKYSRDKKTFIANWREAAAVALGVSPAEAFKDVEQRWRAYAEGEQDKSDAPKRRH